MTPFDFWNWPESHLRKEKEEGSAAPAAPEEIPGAHFSFCPVVDRRLCRVQCNVPSSSSPVIVRARHCSSSCWRSRSISSRIRWQNSLASRRRSPSRALVCLLNNTTNPARYQTPLCRAYIAQLGRRFRTVVLPELSYWTALSTGISTDNGACGGGSRAERRARDASTHEMGCRQL